jgi:hypothetical protein
MNNLSRIELHDCKRTLSQLHELTLKTILQDEILDGVDHKQIERMDLQMAEEYVIDDLCYFKGDEQAYWLNELFLVIVFLITLKLLSIL